MSPDCPCIAEQLHVALEQLTEISSHIAQSSLGRRSDVDIDVTFGKVSLKRISRAYPVDNTPMLFLRKHLKKWRIYEIKDDHRSSRPEIMTFETLTEALIVFDAKMLAYDHDQQSLNKT